MKSLIRNNFGSRFSLLLMINFFLLVVGCSNQDVDADIAHEIAGADWVENQTDELSNSADNLDNRLTQLEEEIQQLFELEAHIPVFSDVTLQNMGWAYEQINYLLDREIIKGYPDEGRFYPNRTVTRYQAAAMIINALGLPILEWEPVFNDIPQGHWAADVAVTAYQNGIFKGSSGNFNPADTLSRAQMAAVLVNTYQLEEIVGKEFITFNDVAEDYWGYNAIKIVNQHEIAKGSNGNFRPNDATTRAQFSIFLTNALKNEEGK